MKQIIVVLIAGLTLWAAEAADLSWQTDLPKALAQAQAEKKLVLVDFTGSDWCEDCKILEEEVYQKPEFTAYAQTNLVLVQLDFPEHKKLAAPLQATNIAWFKKFTVEGFPTLIALRPDGLVAWRLDGYQPGGGPKALIAPLKAARKP